MKRKASSFKKKARAVRQQSYTVRGVLKRHPEGFGFVIPEDKEHPDIYIPATQIGSALSQDQVEVLVHKTGKTRERNSRSVVGLIQSILKRDKEFVAGFVELQKDQVFLARHNLDFPQPLPLSYLKGKNFKEGDYVKARILYSSQWKSPDFDLHPKKTRRQRKSFKGKDYEEKKYQKACHKEENFYQESFYQEHFPFQIELSDNLGSLSASASDDRKRIMAEHNLPFDFSQKVLDQAGSLPSQVRSCDYEDRKDLRHKAFITIDGASAQDFDDAILVEKKEGLYKLYVAIADVSYYVEEGSPLDESAFERGNSTYFPDFCIPMLPEKLSNNLCSLKEKEDRLVMVQEMDFDLKGELVQSHLYPSVIQSQKRLTYTEVEDMLEPATFTTSAPSKNPAPPAYLDSLKQAKSLTQILIQKHKRNQGFDLEIPETLVILDTQGETKELLRETRLFSHKMIEHFMLACNQAVSVFLNQHQVPFIYRIHEKPKKTKLMALEMFAKSLSFSKPIESRKEILTFLNQHQNHERTPLIHKLFLRSMSQARYSSFNKGHYGLNFKLYTHFTSPIRRYSDLIVHRLVKKNLSESSSELSYKKSLSSQKAQKSSSTHQSKSKKASSKKTKAYQEELEKKASWLSTREQRSVKAERRLKDIKSARFLKSRVGESCSGFVSTVTAFGMFITLEDFFVEGLVRFQEMRGFWESDELGLRVENRKNRLSNQIWRPCKSFNQSGLY